MEEDDSMEIDDTISSHQIIEREPTGTQVKDSTENNSEVGQKPVGTDQQGKISQAQAKPQDDKIQNIKTPSNKSLNNKGQNDKIQNNKPQNKAQDKTQNKAPDKTQNKAPDKTQNNKVQGPSDSKKDEVVILDDDDEDIAAPKKKSQDKVVVIDLVEKPQSANSKCINYACKSGKELIKAPMLCLSYYRVKNAGRSKKEVCLECYDIAIKSYDLLATELKKGNLLCDIEMPLRNDTVEIEDSDEEEEELNESDYYDEEEMKELAVKMERVLTDTMEKLNFKSHIEKEKEGMLAKKARIGDSVAEIQKELTETRNALDRIQYNLYKEFKTESYEQAILSIIDDHNVPMGLQSTLQIRNDGPKPPQPRKSQRNVTKRISYAEMDDPNKAQQNSSGQVAGATSKDNKLEESPKDIPLIAPMERLPLLLEETYLVCRQNQTGSWIKARLKAIYPPGTTLDGGPPATEQMYKIVELKQQLERLVDGKCIAAMQPCKTRMETGTRVVTSFKEVTPPNVEPKKVRHDPYYPGIIAEPPVAQNNWRYLVFFDIGYSQYVHYNKVFPVHRPSKDVWEDMHINSRSFIKKYLENQDRPMVKLLKGQTVRTEYNGKWVLCTVKDVDCSLVLVHFETINRMEWIYRGSTRLSPMYKEEQNAAKRHTGGRTMAPSTRKSDESATIVQYTKHSDFEKPVPASPVVVDDAPQKKNVRAVARKSTARPETSKALPANYVPFLPPVTVASAPPPVEPTSKIMYFTPRDTVITQRLLKPHTCSPACRDYVRHNLNKLRGHNPLSKPLLCGWARITMKAKGRKEIVYKAPCSRILRDMDEIHYYLRMTRSDMTVDLFDFNHMVRCLAEFNVDCVADPKDLSGSLEQVAVPVINGINNEMLEFSNYLTKRTPMEDVPLNTDPDFLCGCDCDDDCADKTKCACWQLTLEGAKYMGKNVDPISIGYIYRRLHEQVLTGIYECNSRCKCSSTCLNRVVQNPMSVKLQVFRTHNRGWGIRCVNDVPQGTFICIYAGTIHTEQMANEDGVTYGDEYFAELDYIENCEKHKEDYEAEVLDPELASTKSSRSPSPEEEEEEEEIEGRSSTAQHNGRRLNRWSSRNKDDVDNDFVPGSHPVLYNSDSDNAMRLRKRKEAEDEAAAKTKESTASNGGATTPIKKEPELMQQDVGDVTKEIETVTISDDEDDPKEVLSFNPKTGSDPEDIKPTHPSVRSFFGEEEPYIMDTKNAGNIGRFLNHSCSPNVFVQNVFVDTHDLRFPWVAFFCSQFIRAGTELTWNYNYDIGSVPGRILYCHCGSLECKGRLL